MNDIFNEEHEQVQKAASILPAWFVPRMMTDSWCFGLMLTTGQTLCISSIMDVEQSADGTVWLDVLMLPRGDARNYQALCAGPVMGAPTSRLEASVNAAHVVAAFELADT